MKNLTTAEGGALTWKDRPGLDSAALYHELQLLSLHGQSKDALAKTKIGSWEYDIVGPYYKCNMTDIMAALGLVQLRRYPEILKRRRQIIEMYNEGLKDLPVSATIFLVVYLKQGAFGRIAGNALGLAIIFLPCYIFLYARHFKPQFSKEALKYAVGFGFPIVIHLLMGTIHNSIDRLMLEHYLPISELGIYTLGISVATVLQMFVTAFNQAYQPSYYELMESGGESREDHIVKTFKFWLVMLTLATCIGIVIGGPFLTIFAGSQFRDVSSIFPYLLLSVYAGSFYFFFSSPIFFYKKTHLLPLITGSSAVINIVMNLLLIPRYGINGAAIATSVSHIWISAISYLAGNRLFRVKWPWIYLACSLICVSVAFFIQVCI